MRVFLFCLLGYFFMALVTFGYVAANTDDCFNSFTGNRKECQNLDKVIAGYSGGIFWPFYWSWEIFD